YNSWADSNRLIVLYPQTVPRHGPAFGSLKWITNPFSCWDWWGYTGRDYSTRHGVQIKAVRAMLERLAAPREQ
ncbi:MAG: poly(3-hydroxybutyrate) depolymerase, partial [Candidatus Accumulibacter sp.]|nr:poly(3-hydroxybutyrate) depolymerase [Accumulibacter sp.]